PADQRLEELRRADRRRHHRRARAVCHALFCPRETHPIGRAAVTRLGELFPEGEYRFHLTLRRAEPREFFQAHDSSGRVLVERARWLNSNPTRYAALKPEGQPRFEEFAALARAWKLIGPDASSLVQLGRSLEPDLLLLAPDMQGNFRLHGGVLCFPTGWALEEKLGHTIDFIHGVV